MICERRAVWLWAAALLALGSSGCLTTELDLRSVPYPVLVSPILKVGDTTPTEYAGSKFADFNGEASTSSVSSGSSHYVEAGGKVYHVTETYYAHEEDNSFLQSLQDATGGRDDVIVIVDALRTNHLVHMSLIGYAAKSLSIEGTLYQQDELVFEEEP